jgi:hypothetical protein
VNVFAEEKSKRVFVERPGQKKGNYSNFPVAFEPQASNTPISNYYNKEEKRWGSGNPRFLCYIPHSEEVFI